LRPRLLKAVITGNQVRVRGWCKEIAGPGVAEAAPFQMMKTRISKSGAEEVTKTRKIQKTSRHNFKKSDRDGLPPFITEG